MKKYEISVIVGDKLQNYSVIAEYLEPENGYYCFWYNDDEIIACYPINFTIIKSVEKIEDYE